MKIKIIISSVVVILSLVSCQSWGMLFPSKNYKHPTGWWDVPEKYEKMENPYANVIDDNNIGRTIYLHHCISCHGKEGYGDGYNARNIWSRIGDFTISPFQEQSDGNLYYKIIKGNNDMPSFRKKIKNNKARWMLVNYLRTLEK